MALVRITRDLTGPRLYIGRWHVHHGLQGLVMIAIGAVLVWHDKTDFPFHPLR
jgi:hypothetical protein